MYKFLVLFCLVNTALFAQVDHPPLFGDCTNTALEQSNQCTHVALQTYIKENLSYPQKAISAGQEGLVMVQVQIDKTGKATNPSIQLSKCAACEPEAIRLVEGMDKWKPAVKNQEPIDAIISIPIYFNIEDSVSLSTDLFLQWGNLGEVATKKQLQKQLKTKMTLKDNFDNTYPINELYFAFEKDSTLVDAYSPNGKQTKDHKSVIKKIETGGLFVVAAFTKVGILTKPVYRTFKIIE